MWWRILILLHVHAFVLTQYHEVTDGNPITWLCFFTPNFALIGEWFSMWRPSAIVNLQNFDSLSRDRPWKENVRQLTKFRWNRMIAGWDIAIKPFSKRQPSAILHFWNLVFWSPELWLNVIAFLRTKFRVNIRYRYRA